MQAPISSDLGFDPFAPSYLHDPYPTFSRLRERPPFYAPAIDMWVPARYEDRGPHELWLALGATG